MSYTSSKADKESNKSQDKFTSTFITIMMVIFLFSSVFRKFYNDQPLFKIGRQKYSVSHCRKYIAYIDSGSNLSKEEKFARYFHQVLNIAKRKAAISNLCDSLGFKVSHSDLMNSILNDFSFSENGDFSRKKFLDSLKKMGVSENEFYDLRREELMHQQFWYFLTNSYALSSDLVKRFNESYFAVRRIRFAKVNHSDISIQYSDKDLLAFYEKNKELFKTTRGYKYEGVVLSAKNFSNEDLVFLTRVVNNNNFESIIKNYKNYATSISNDKIIERFGNGFAFYDYGKNLSVGDCFQFRVNDSIYVIKVISVEESKVKPFNDVKKHVINLYEKEKKPLKISINSLVWNTFYCSADDFYSLNFPYDVAKKALISPVGKLSSLHENGVSYFWVVDSISSSKKEDASDFLLRDFLDSEIRFSVKNYLLGFLEEV